MKGCRKFGSLIYLYREGELSADERRMVLEHSATCKRCHHTLQQLLSIDAALSPLRSSVPEHTKAEAIVNEALNRIAKSSLSTKAHETTVSFLDEIFSWVRPALSYLLLAAGALLITQQSRDAIRVEELENRLRLVGDLAVSVEPPTTSETQRLLDVASARLKKELQRSASLRNATIGADPVRPLGSKLTGLFEHDKGLFDYLSRRFPELSGITIDDGIDDRERAILASGGDILRKEIETLSRVGGR